MGSNNKDRDLHIHQKVQVSQDSQAGSITQVVKITIPTILVVAIIAYLVIQMFGVNGKDAVNYFAALNPTPTPVVSSTPVTNTFEKRVLILVADFDGPDPQKYRITETIINRLREKMNAYPNIEVRSLGRAISENEGSRVAQIEGQRENAGIVIWGWYGITDKAVPIGIHFETIETPVNESAVCSDIKPNGWVWPNSLTNSMLRTASINDLETVNLQNGLSNELTCTSNYTLGYARFIINDFEGAINYFTQALNLIDENPELAKISGFATDERLIPNKEFIYLMRGRAYLDSNKLDAAVADFNKVIEINCGIADGYVYRAMTFIKKQKYPDAIADLNKAIEIKADNGIFYYLRGKAYQLNHDQQSMQADYNKALEIDFLKVADYAYSEMKSKYLLSVSENQPEYETTNGVVTNETIKNYVLKLMKGDCDAVINDFPNNVMAYLIRGRVLGELQDKKAALADYIKATQINPRVYYFYRLTGEMYTNLADYPVAIKYYSTAIDIDPKNPYGYIGRGDSYLESGDLDNALADYSKAISINPQINSCTYKKRGFIYLQKSKFDTALQDLDKSILLSPKEPYFYMSRGYAFLQKGDLKSAETNYQKAISLKPDYAEAYHALGSIYQKQNRMREALDTYAKIIKIDPEYANKYNITGYVKSQRIRFGIIIGGAIAIPILIVLILLLHFTQKRRSTNHAKTRYEHH